MTLELMNLRQSYLGLDDPERTGAAEVLRGFFHQALEGCNPADSEKLLSKIDNYFQKMDFFTPRAVDNYVSQLQELQSKSGVGQKVLRVGRCVRQDAEDRYGNRSLERRDR